MPILSAPAAIPFTVDVDMIDVAMRVHAGRLSVHHLPPEVLAHCFGFLPELVPGPIEMTRTALNVTHVNSWFRDVGIALQPRLWTRLPLQNKELFLAFWLRSGDSSPFEIMWSPRLRWCNEWFVAVLFEMLDLPGFVPRIRVFEVQAPHNAEDFGEVYRHEFREYAAKLLRSLMGTASERWVSLERFHMVGLKIDLSVPEPASDDDEWMDEDISDEYRKTLRKLTHDDEDLFVGIRQQLRSLHMLDLFPPYGILYPPPTQLRCLFLDHLWDMSLENLAERLSHMPHLEYVELHEVAGEWDDDWDDGLVVHLPQLRRLVFSVSFQTHMLEMVKEFLDHIIAPKAWIEAKIPVHGRWWVVNDLAKSRDVSFVSRPRSKRIFTCLPVEKLLDGWKEPISAEDIQFNREQLASIMGKLNE